MDSRVNSRTNTCSLAQLGGRAVLIGNRTSPGNPCLIGES